MTPDQIRDLIIVTAILAPIIVLIIVCILSMNKKYVGQAVADIDSYISNNVDSNRDVIIYTTGHPYTWSQISRAELNKAIKDHSWLPVTSVTGMPVPQPPRYLINYNRDRNSIHIVFTHKKSFDWDSLKFYDEYVKRP